jgi:hypothetical protein
MAGVRKLKGVDAERVAKSAVKKMRQEQCRNGAERRRRAESEA